MKLLFSCPYVKHRRAGREQDSTRWPYTNRTKASQFVNGEIAEMAFPPTSLRSLGDAYFTYQHSAYADLLAAPIPIYCLSPHTEAGDYLFILRILLW